MSLDTDTPGLLPPKANFKAAPIKRQKSNRPHLVNEAVLPGQISERKMVVQNASESGK